VSRPSTPKVDTEVRKLDQLRSAHLTQQHTIRLQVQSLPEEIRQRRQRIERLSADIERRDAHAGEDFSMTVGGRVYSGKGAREAAAAALTQTVMAGRAEAALRVRGAFRGFELVSRGRPQGAVLIADNENLPELLIRGAGTFAAQVNPDSPVGTVQSIEHALRALDKALADERERLARSEKMLADFYEQLGRPFEHEARLKELVARQAELNAALDLDKGEQQAAPAADEAQGAGGDGRAPEQEAAGGLRTRPRYERMPCEEEEPGGDDDLETPPPDDAPVVPSRSDMRL
jgi:hypothetical protein